MLNSDFITSAFKSGDDVREKYANKNRLGVEFGGGDDGVGGGGLGCGTGTSGCSHGDGVVTPGQRRRHRRRRLELDVVGDNVNPGTAIATIVIFLSLFAGGCCEVDGVAADHVGLEEAGGGDQRVDRSGGQGEGGGGAGDEGDGGADWRGAAAGGGSS